MTLTPAESLTLDQLTALTVEVASELTRLRNETWKIYVQAEPPAVRTPTVRLTGPGHAALDLSFGWWRTGKLTIDGVFPEGVSVKGFSANLSPARGAAVIAREVSRRVIDAGYLDELATAVARKTAQDARDAARLALLTQAAAVFGLDGPSDADADRMYLGEVFGGNGYTEAGRRPGMLSLNLGCIPAEVALAMLKVLADAAVPAEHEHQRDGQTLRHTHPCGAIEHGYFGHSEDYPPIPAGPGEYRRV